MDYKGFIGIDVSKNTLDAVSIIKGKRTGEHQQFSNDLKGFRGVLKWSTKVVSCKKNELLFCMEHTGVYTYKFSCFLSEKEIDFCLENPLQIKRSMGVSRIKNDKADAQLIARYAMRHQEDLKLYVLPSKSIAKLKHLLSHRDRLLKSKHAFKVASNELSKHTNKEDYDFISKDSKSLVKVLDKRIEKIDLEIKQLIESEESLKKNYDLAMSVGGVGKATASHIIAYTNNFASFSNSRQFACYSGIAPFEHSSGISLKGRTRISPLANKKMKGLLSIGACSAIQHDKELRNYYNKRVEEGKAPMSVINIIRNKIVSRVFAVVKRGTPYVSVANYN
jgi:transposase